MHKSFRFRALMPQHCAMFYDEFPGLLERFRLKNPTTEANEDEGARLCKAGFKNTAAVRDFVNQVCKWGGRRGPGIAARVLRNNKTADIQRAFRDATASLQGARADAGHALQAILALKGLEVSFASKHLRFLCPRWCPVLDAIISQRLVLCPEVAVRYPLEVPGYRDFARDCGRLAAKLTSDHIPHPFKRKGGEWYAADVEASLYAFLNNW